MSERNGRFPYPFFDTMGFGWLQPFLGSIIIQTPNTPPPPPKKIPSNLKEDTVEIAVITGHWAARVLFYFISGVAVVGLWKLATGIRRKVVSVSRIKGGGERQKVE